jgi:hypothetical protein
MAVDDDVAVASLLAAPGYPRTGYTTTFSRPARYSFRNPRVSTGENFLRMWWS